MVLYGWWYLIGVAVIVLFWAIFIAPGERKHFKRRLDLLQKRIRKHDEQLEEEKQAEENLELERKHRAGRRWNKYRPPPLK